MVFIAAPIEERIQNYIEMPGPLATKCWIWQASCKPKRYGEKGYGEVWWNGRRHLAHRVKWQLHYGEIPDEIQCCHHCDVPSCINPDHLFLGTPADNIADMFAKGRQGDRKGINALLTEDQVSLIKFFLSQGWSQAALGKRYGVGPDTIYAIAKGLNWPYVKPFEPVPGQSLPVPPEPTPRKSKPPKPKAQLDWDALLSNISMEQPTFNDVLNAL
jgi:HNH endonuclease